MKYAGTVCGIVVFVLCFALMAYADPTAPATEDKTEATKVAAEAEAKAQLKPYADRVKNQFNEVLKDRELAYEEMKLLRKAVKSYQSKLANVNKHLAVYKVSLISEAYPPAVKLTELYFTNLFFGNGRWHKDEMRLLAAKEGVDIQNIGDYPSLFWLLILLAGVVCIVISTNRKTLPLLLLGIGISLLSLIYIAFL
jgi:hypothetical protein